MRGTFTNFLENKILDRVVRNVTTYSAPTTGYLALMVALSADGDTITECTGTGYARVPVSYGAAAAYSISNDAEISFPQAGGSWGTVKYLVEFDAPTGGNPMNYWRVDQGFAVTAVSTGSKTFTIAGDQTATLVTGVEIEIRGSTGNDGFYTIASAGFGGGNTVVTVNETIPSATADGNLFGPLSLPITSPQTYRIPIGMLTLGIEPTGSFSEFLANTVLNYYWRNVTWPLGSVRAVALFTAQSGDTVTECTGGGYARIDCSACFGTAASSGSVANSAPIAFAPSTGSWGAVIADGVYDATTGGNLLLRGPLVSGITVAPSSNVEYGIGEMIATLN